MKMKHKCAAGVTKLRIADRRTYTFFQKNEEVIF